MGFVGGVHLLPATGEFTYDTIPYQAAQPGGVCRPAHPVPQVRPRDPGCPTAHEGKMSSLRQALQFSRQGP